MSTTSETFSLLLRINPTKFMRLNAFILELLLTRGFAQKFAPKIALKVDMHHSKMPLLELCIGVG